MEQTETTATESSERKPRSPELVRPVQGRMLAGVAQGVADNFGISEWIPRVFFIVTAFMGGLGIALYAAGWAFIRSEDEPESIAARFFSGASTSRSWLGVGLMVVAGIIILSNFTFLRGEVIWAGAFLIVGLLLYLGYIPTRSGSKTESSTESKEGVQQVTPTETLDNETAEIPSGDSPAGGTTPPPPTPTPTPPDLPLAKPKETSILGRLTIGVMLLGLGVLAILDNLQALAIDAEPRHYMALAVTILGIGLLVGSFAGRARWLILLGVIMIPTLMFSPLFEVDWNSEDFDQVAVPTAFSEVESNYEINFGSLEIDLTDLPWNGEEIAINASVNAGRIEIQLPEGVGIVGRASVDVGQVAAQGRTSAGIGNPGINFNAPGEEGTILLDAEVNLGQIEINR
jgi:phage shock protein PspC (stress-responsive transcriptional regulator)